VDKSLVHAQDETEGEFRFVMLETIREYAQERLSASGELDTCRAHHAAYLLGLAESAETALDGPDQRRWLARLEADHDNFRAALRWTLTLADGEAVQRLAGALWRFWSVHGHLSEGRTWLERALTRGQRSGGRGQAAVLAKARHGAGALAFRQGDLAQARNHFEAAAVLHRALDVSPGLVQARASLGVLAGFAGDHARAVALLSENVRYFRAEADELGLCRALGDLGRACLLVDDRARAVALLEEALQRGRALGHQRVLARTLTDLGRAVAGLGELDRAEALHAESLAIYAAGDERWGRAVVLANLADLARRRGQMAAAERRYRESLALWHELGDRVEIAACLDGLVAVALRRGDAAAAARLLGAAAVFGATTEPRVPQVARVDQDLPAAVCQVLGGAAFAAARAAGQVRASELVAAIASGREP
jgi:tetratricopeptide (TPR) repeat protein